jgi:hypothetical protein
VIKLETKGKPLFWVNDTVGLMKNKNIRRTASGFLITALRSAKQLVRPFSAAQCVFPAWFWIMLAALAAIKLWLVGTQALTARFLPHDDVLFLNLAQNIANGEWLGAYNNVTLVKEPFYPCWIAAIFWLGIPLCFSQQLLYVCSCLMFIIAIRSLLRNVPLLLLVFYTALLFHPISYPVPNGMHRVLREGIYLSLPLMVFSFATGLLLRKDAPIKKLVIWNIGLGFSFAAFWLTREEGVILIPSLFLLVAALFFSIWVFSREKKKRMAACCISIALACAIVGAVAGINKIYYGVFTTCEHVQSDFVSAYGSLLRVKPKLFQQYLPVARETRERIYAASPAFAELRPFLEAGPGKEWAKYGPLPYAGKDISTHFIWAFNDAVALAGYYGSGDSAAKYHERLAAEVNNACDKEVLECYPGRHDSLMPIWRNEDLMPLISIFAEKAFSIMRHADIEIMFRDPSNVNDTVLNLFRDMTRDRIAPREGDPSVLNGQQRVDALKLRLLNSLLSLLRPCFFILVLLGIVSYVCQMALLVIKRKFSFSFVITTALLLAVFARIFLFSLIDVTTWPGSSSALRYQTSLYPVLAAFSLLSVVMLFLKDSDEYSISFSSFRLK